MGQRGESVDTVQVEHGDKFEDNIREIMFSVGKEVSQEGKIRT